MKCANGKRIFAGTKRTAYPADEPWEASEENGIRVEGQTCHCRTHTASVVQLLDEPQLPNRVVTVITERTRETTWPTFQKEICRILGFEPGRVDIPDGSTADDILQIPESVANKIPKDAQLAR